MYLAKAGNQAAIGLGSFVSTRPGQSIDLKFVATNTLIVQEIAPSVALYREALGATVLCEGETTFLRPGRSPI